MLIPGKVLHNETQRHVARMATRNDDHIEDLDALIRGLIYDGIWPILSTLCVVGPTSADSLLDIKGNQDSVLVGSPAFVADRGFTTSGTTNVIDTQYTFTSAHDNNHGLSVYPRASSALFDNYHIGEAFSVSPHQIAFKNTNVVTISAYSQDVTGRTKATVGGGFRSFSRVDSSGYHICADGSISSWSAASGAWGSSHYPIPVGCRNNEGTLDKPLALQYAHWACTFGLTQAQTLLYHTRIKTYLTARGAAV